MHLSATLDNTPASVNSPENYNFSRLFREQAFLNPDKKAIIYATRKSKNGRVVYGHVTLAELDRLSDQFARGLVQSGIRRGTKTVLMAKPDKEFFPLTLALFKVGAVPVLVDPGMGIARMLHCIRSTQPEAFIGIPLAHIVRILSPRFFCTIKTWVTVGRKWFWGGATTLTMKKKFSAGFDIALSAQDELAAIVFTTGSTGPAKGVEYTHGMFAAMISQLVNNFNPGTHEVDLATFPLFTLFDVSLGITAVLPDMDPARPASADPEKIVESITDNSVTTMFASPALLKNLSEYCRKNNIKLSSIQRIISGGAPITPEVAEGVKNILIGNANFFITYGATEAVPISAIESSIILSETRHATAQGGGSCIGRAFPGIEVKIITINEDPVESLHPAIEVPSGTIGEIIVSGDIVSKKYYERPEENLLSKISDDSAVWHRTGDLGWIDAQGRIWFCGRKKQRVIAAEKVYYTIPCESVFNAHPAVFRTALVGAAIGKNIIPVICVELHAAYRNTAKKIITEELRSLAMGNAITHDIRVFLFHDAFPVDIRHNSKIGREKLSLWAKKLISQNGYTS